MKCRAVKADSRPLDMMCWVVYTSSLEFREELRGDHLTVLLGPSKGIMLRSCANSREVFVLFSGIVYLKQMFPKFFFSEVLEVLDGLERSGRLAGKNQSIFMQIRLHGAEL